MPLKKASDAEKYIAMPVHNHEFLLRLFTIFFREATFDKHFCEAIISLFFQFGGANL